MPVPPASEPAVPVALLNGSASAAVPSSPEAPHAVETSGQGEVAAAVTPAAAPPSHISEQPRANAEESALQVWPFFDLLPRCRTLFCSESLQQNDLCDNFAV